MPIIDFQSFIGDCFSMPKATKPVAAVSRDEWKLQACSLNINDTILAKFELDLDRVLQHHVFADVLKAKPVQIATGLQEHEAGHQAGFAKRVFDSTQAGWKHLLEFISISSVSRCRYLLKLN